MNQLNRKSEFAAVLKGYQLSDHAKALLAELKLVLLCGLSGVGRNTIIDQLVKQGNYWYIVSDTTRKPRINNNIKEQNGVTYWFRSEEELLRDLKAGEFLEAEIIHGQQVSGISIRELENANSSGKIAITDMDIGGLLNVTKLKPDVVSVILLPPSFSEWLNRLTSRGQMPESEVISRLTTGEKILHEALNNQQVQLVINDRLNQAVADVDALAHGKSIKPVSNEFVSELLNQTKNYLKQT